jgi:hypothetical protein
MPILFFSILLFTLLIILICIISNIIIISYHNIKKGGSTKKIEVLTPTPPPSIEISYTISGEGNGLNYSILRQMLKSNDGGNFITHIEKAINEKVHISFGSYGGFKDAKKGVNLNLSPEFYKQHASIKNVLNKHSGFINKTELYETIRRLIPLGIKYIPATYTIAQFKNSLSINFPAILKKNFSCRQQGVKVIESIEDYYKAKKELDIKEDGIISEYITNPLLLDEKKIHLRIYYLLSVVSGITRCFVYDLEYRIYIAEEKYKKSDWLNPHIHISGVSGKASNRRYIWPNDISAYYDIHEINKQLNEFNTVICIALASSNVKNYEESNAGYQLYGADVLITDEFKPYLIEINKHPGFSRFGDIVGWEEYINKFSTNFFHFILSSVVFPYFGLCRPNSPNAEFIDNGTLSSFGNILTGDHKCVLIPMFACNTEELDIAKKMNFYGMISFDHTCKECAQINIFLISYGNTVSKFGSVIIGFIAMTNDLFLKIAILEEYQNRGIATAMVAQFMEIQYARHYTGHIPILKIRQKSSFLKKIAEKLHFTHIKDCRYFERSCKLHNSILTKINTNKLLTYKIVNDDGLKNTILELKLPHMAQSNSQFVHLLYSPFYSDRLNIKGSTGNRYNKTFIYQGAELKSSIYAVQLKNIILFKKYIYANAIFDNTIFDQVIDKTIFDQELYNICNDHNIIKVVTKSELIKHAMYKNAIYIEEYNPPFLIDSKLMLIRFRVLIYISGNNVYKYFVFNERKVIIDNEIYDKMRDHKFLSCDINKYTFPNDFKTGELSEFANNNLSDFILKFINMVNILPLTVFSESNAGFLNIFADIKFIIKNGKYQPILYNIWNYDIVLQNQIKNIENYYHWIQNSVINPHFGFYCNDIKKPILCHVKNPISPNISSKIICELLLQFNKERDHIDILYSVDNNKLSKIGSITLNLTNIVMNIIELKSINLDKIENLSSCLYAMGLNVIFVLLDILGAYYAPNNPQFILNSDLYSMSKKKELEFIAFELKFSKGTSNSLISTKDYYIRKCRI